MARRYSAILFRVFIVSRLVGRLLEREVDGLASDQIGLFSAIGTWQPITPTELARRSGTKPTTLSDVIRRFEERGWIVKTPNPNDGRSYLISLTREGSKVWEIAGPGLARAIEMAEDALDDELDEVVDSLMTLENRLRELLGDEAAIDYRAQSPAIAPS
jgi:DNA-binding MarR family transcriptional regulator